MKVEAGLIQFSLASSLVLRWQCRKVEGGLIQFMEMQVVLFIMGFELIRECH